MDRSPFSWKSFILGATVGLIVGALVTGAVLGRYTITRGGPYGIIAVRLDRLTGKTESWNVLRGQVRHVFEDEPEKKPGKMLIIKKGEPCPEGYRCLTDDIGLFKDK